MTTPVASRRPLRGRTLLLSAAAALGAAAFTAPAASAAVTLDWSTANVANSSAPANTERTWLGYVTNPTPMSGAQGTASPIVPASGSTVTPASARGVDQLATWSFPASRGTLNPLALSATMEFNGGVRFFSPGPAPAAGHGFTITVENPRVELVNGRGFLYASGLHTPGRPDSAPVPYDRSQPVFALDNAAWTVNADGSNSITMTPAVAVTAYVFPNNYTAGAGPERTPNTFGTFSIRVDALSGPKGDKGDKGDAGAKGEVGERGASGKPGITKVVRIQRSVLRTAPFKGKAARKVRVTGPKGKKTVANGVVRGRVLRVTLASTLKRKQLKGVFVLQVVGKKATAKVRLP